MSEFKTHIGELRIIKGKDSTDARMPRVAPNPDANGELAKFYHVSFKAFAGTKNINGITVRLGDTQTHSETVVIFEKGNRDLIFQDLYDICQDTTKFKVAGNGDLLINPEAGAWDAVTATEECGFHYFMTDSTGKPRVDKNNIPIIRNTVTVFLFASELEKGKDISIINTAIKRAYKTKLTPQEEKSIYGEAEIPKASDGIADIENTTNGTTK